MEERAEEITEYINQKRKLNNEIENYRRDTKDGTFFMDFTDFRNIWTHVCFCYKLPNEWSGYRFYGKWGEKNSGGSPIDKNAFRKWAKNPEYSFVLKRKDEKQTQFMVMIGQNDGKT